MERMISVSTTKYSTLFKRILDEYASDIEIYIDGRLYDDADIPTLKQTWCSNKKIEATHDFWLKRNDRTLFGFHDHPAELFAAESELDFLEQLHKEGIIRHSSPQLSEEIDSLFSRIIGCFRRS